MLAAGVHSSASLSACNSKATVKQKSVCLILSSSGLIEGIIPLSFALIITPVSASDKCKELMSMGKFIYA
jgi:hypothetical protein